MQLLESWKQSLLLFKPANFKLFFLVTLKSIIRTYTIWFTYWGWLIGLFYISVLAKSMLQATVGILGSIGILASVILQFTLFLIVRPSVARKNYNYFMGYLWSRYFIWFVVYNLLLFACKILLINFLVMIAVSPIMVFSFLTSLYLPYCFSILFLLDGDGTWRSAGGSLIRGWKMMAYNIPFAGVFCGVLACGIVVGVQPLAENGLLLRPILLCFVANFYIKRVHDQFDVYFPETVKGE